MKIKNRFIVITTKITRRLYWLFAVSILLIVVNGVLNFTVRNATLMGYTSIITSVGLFLSLRAFINNKDIKRSYLRALIFISIQILAAGAIAGLRPTVLLWIYPLPLIAFYTQGSRVGLIYSLSVFITYNFVKILSSYISGNPNMQISYYMEAMIIFLVLLALTYNYQLSLQQRDKKIYRQLQYDEMTGLPKRVKLIQDIRKHSFKTLILINVDGFGRINRLIGVPGGDYLLKEIAERLLKFSIEFSSYNVYKLSSDEFAILIPELKSARQIRSLVDQLSTIIEKEIIIDNTSIIIRATMGVSSSLEKILTTCDIALKLAKKQRKPYQIYNNSLNDSQFHKENLTRLYKLQKAIENDLIIPFYQPIICNKTNTVYKYECLIRQKEADKIIGPSEFLELSKGARIYPELTKIMISKSFDYFSEKDVYFSINLSLDDILDSSTTDFIFSNLEKYKIGSRLTFELLESERIEEFPEVLRFVEKIRSYNCSIAIDDFGSGYSNFDMLLKFKFDFIKLDGSIIQNLVHDEKAQILVESLVAFAEKMGAKTIAEYVKDKEISERVCQIGIDYSQGYYLGEPKDRISQTCRTP